MIAELRSMADVDALAARWAVGTVETNHTASEDAGHIQDVNQIGSILDFANRKIDFLVESLIAVGTITMIAGDSGCGKSTFSTAVCGAVATGKPFAGLATQQRPVLILDRENPLSIVVDRFTRLGVSDSKTFKVWGGWADDEAPSPGSPVIQRWVESCDPKPLILVDSLIAFLDGDENDARQSREFMQQLRRLADMGATVVVLHHSGKAETSKDYRGSSDFKAAIDIGYRMANMGDPMRLSVVRLKAFKARFVVATDSVFSCFEGRFLMDNRPAATTNEEILRDLLIEHPGVAVKAFTDLAAEKGVARNRTRTFLDQGSESGRIRVELGPHNTKFLNWNQGENEL